MSNAILAWSLLLAISALVLILSGSSSTTIFQNGAIAQKRGNRKFQRLPYTKKFGPTFLSRDHKKAIIIINEYHILKAMKIPKI